MNDSRCALNFPNSDDTSLVLAVGTQSKSKINAVISAAEKIFKSFHKKIEIFGLKVRLSSYITLYQVNSGVSDQPMSDNEAIEGAITRAKNALKAYPNAHFGILNI